MVMAAIGGALVGGLVAWALFRPMFGTTDEFIDCVRFWLTPDAYSWFRGEGPEDSWAELKLWLWLVVSGAMGAVTYAGLSGAFG